MPYCSRCGVEVDTNVEKCPLCEAPIQKLPEDDGSPWPREEAPGPQAPPRSTEERIALARTITTLGFLIPAFIVLAVDFFVSRRLSWSLFVLIALAAAWLWTIMPLVITRHPYFLIGSLSLIGIAEAWGLGLMARDISWILPVAMPIVAAAGGASALVVLLTKKSKSVGSNLAGWILIAISILAVITDVLVSARFLGTWRPGWSLIVAGTMVPISLLLLYLHYRPSRRTRLRRYFHV